MAPTTSSLTKALIETTQRIFHSAQRDSLSVTFVRGQVVEKYALDDDFFVRDEWKRRSKQLVQDEAVGLV